MLFPVLIWTLLEMSVCEKYFAPSLFLNHGGGPLPILGEQSELEIAESLRNVDEIVDLKRLKAIIVVTAHREEDVVTISNGEHHDLLYDYYNFPPESYTFKYNAPGDPILAGKIRDAFVKANIPSQLDSERGWDHGVFIPMMLINPSEDIPIVQVSILKNQNAEQHYKIGEVLNQFRKEGIAIFGSGMSYHNMKQFRSTSCSGDPDKIVNESFDNFLNEVCTGDVENRKKILDWQDQVEGLESHPLGKADHLMPLIVNAGAGGLQPGKKIFNSVYCRKFQLSGYIWDKE